MMDNHSKASKRSGPIIPPRTIFSSTKTNIDPILSVKNLSVSYGKAPVFRGLNLELHKPSLLTILGKNGSGKSTFLKALNGSQAFSGSISLHGSDPMKFRSRDKAAIMALVPQMATLSVDMTVEELVLFGRIRFKKLFMDYSSKDRDAVERSLRKFGLLEKRKDLLSELSGGERQLAWLAQVDTQDALFISLDEPTLNLDLGNKKFVFDCIRNWIEKEGKTVILVTHDLHYLYGFKGGFGLNLSEKEPHQRILDATFLDQSRSTMEAYF